MRSTSGNGNKSAAIREGNCPRLQAQIDGAWRLADREVGIHHSSFNIHNFGRSLTRHAVAIAGGSHFPLARAHDSRAGTDFRGGLHGAHPRGLGAGDGPSGNAHHLGLCARPGRIQPQARRRERHLDLPGNAARRRPGGGHPARVQDAHSFGEVGNCAGRWRKSETRKWKLTSGPVSDFQSPVSSTGAGQQTADKAKEVAQFIRANLFSGLEWQDHRGSWHTQSWKDVVRYALRMQDFGAACVRRSHGH